jgi:excisionase family DNA binding protein
MMNAAYVSTGEAARALGVGLTTLRTWAAEGKVTPAYRTPGGHLRWDLADLRRQLGMQPPEPGQQSARPPSQS